MAERKTQNWLLGIIVILSIAHLFSSYLVVLNPTKIIHQNDSQSYIDFGTKIYNSVDKPFWEQDLGVGRTPGFPLLVSFIFSFNAENHGWIIVSQSIVLILSAFILYEIISKFYNRGIALLGVLLLLLDPISFIYTKVILTETLFTFCLLLLLWVFIHYRKEGKVIWLFLVGILLVLVIYIRPIGMGVLVVFLLVNAILDWKEKKSLKLIFRNFLILNVISFIGIYPWVLRNQKYSGCKTYSIKSKLNFRDWMAAPAMSINQDIPLSEAKTIIRSGVDLCEDSTIRFLNLMLENYPGYLRLHISGLASMFIGFDFDKWSSWFNLNNQYPDFWNPLLNHGPLFVGKMIIREMIKTPKIGVLMIVLEMYQLIFYSLIVWGLLKIKQFPDKKVKEHSWVLISIIVLLVNMAAPVGDPRFRVPLNPLFIFFIVSGIAYKDNQKDAAKFIDQPRQLG
jgi:4-amino-4-deoxy-L-arabinose transferase-like glycosyltransferase